MKNITLSAIASMLLANVAYAESFYREATITNVKPIYETVLVDRPTTVCSNVEVPIYGTTERQGNAAGGALAGMIIGGIIGKGATGKDDGAAAGAIIGGLIGADQGSRPKSERVIVGYKTERQCSNIIETQEVRQIGQYAITYTWSTLSGVYYSPNSARIGDKIEIKVTVSITN